MCGNLAVLAVSALWQRAGEWSHLTQPASALYMATVIFAIFSIAFNMPTLDLLVIVHGECTCVAYVSAEDYSAYLAQWMQK